MNVNFELLNTFYQVARVGNISKAANILYVSQPAITKSIKKLENLFGIKLFIRNVNGVSLTYEGKFLFDYIQPHIDGLVNSTNKLNSLKNLDEGCINIGAGTSLTRMVLLPNIVKFNDKYPNIKIKIIHSITSNLIRDLRYGNLDFILLNLPYDAPKDLIMEPCMEIHDCFVASSDKFDKSLLSKISFKELNNYPLILQQKNSNTRTFLDNVLEKQKVNLIPNLELSSISLIKDFVENGLGIGFLPEELIKEELSSGLLFKLEISESIPSRNIGLITNKNMKPCYAAQKFIEFFKNTCIITDERWILWAKIKRLF